MHKIPTNLKNPTLQHLNKIAWNLREKHRWTVFIEYSTRTYYNSDEQVSEFLIAMQDAGHPDGCLVRFCPWAELKDLYFSLMDKGISAWPNNKRDLQAKE